MAQQISQVPQALHEMSPQLLRAAGLAARLTGQSTGGYVAQALRAALARTMAERAGRPLPAGLTALVAQAADWLDLQARLRAAGLVLRADGALFLHRWPDDRRLVPLAALGVDEAELTLRFRAPFPGRLPAGGAGAGHGHWIAPRPATRPAMGFAHATPGARPALRLAAPAQAVTPVPDAGAERAAALPASAGAAGARR